MDTCGSDDGFNPCGSHKICRSTDLATHKCHGEFSCAYACDAGDVGVGVGVRASVGAGVGGGAACAAGSGDVRAGDVGVGVRAGAGVGVDGTASADSECSE